MKYWFIDLIDFLLLLPRVCEGMPTGVLLYAEHEYDNRFARIIDFIDSSRFLPRVGEDMSTGILRYAEHEYDNHS